MLMVGLIILFVWIGVGGWISFRVLDGWIEYVDFNKLVD